MIINNEITDPQMIRWQWNTWNLNSSEVYCMCFGKWYIVKHPLWNSQWLILSGKSLIPQSVGAEQLPQIASFSLWFVSHTEYNSYILYSVQNEQKMKQLLEEISYCYPIFLLYTNRNDVWSETSLLCLFLWQFVIKHDRQI